MRLSHGFRLLSPAGARVVTLKHWSLFFGHLCYCPPQGRELLPSRKQIITYYIGCCPPQGRELLPDISNGIDRGNRVAVPRRGASCYQVIIDRTGTVKMLLSPAGARAVTAKMRKIQCGFSAFLQSFCIIFCIFAYPFVILSVFPGANLPVTT